MIHDVIFNYNETDAKSAYKDWNMVLTNVDDTLPEPKTTTVDIKGADGVLDLSTVATGDIQYNNRKLSLTFEMMKSNDYNETKREIVNYLHGKTIKLNLTSDSGYFFEGRATVNKWECSGVKRTIVIDLDAYPFRKRKFEVLLVGNGDVTPDYIQDFENPGLYLYKVKVKTRKPIIPLVYAEVPGFVLNGVNLKADVHAKYDGIVLNNGENFFEFNKVTEGTLYVMWEEEML